LARRVNEFLRSIIGRSQRGRLAGVLGLTADFSADDFDQEKVIVVEDGRERKINVTTGWPQFTYAIESDGRLSDEKFVEEVTDVARDMLVELNVDLASNWRPQF
jgi:hypothetical protein